VSTLHAALSASTNPTTLNPSSSPVTATITKTTTAVANNNNASVTGNKVAAKLSTDEEIKQIKKMVKRFVKYSKYYLLDTIDLNTKCRSVFSWTGMLYAIVFVIINVLLYDYNIY